MRLHRHTSSECTNICMPKAHADQRANKIPRCCTEQTTQTTHKTERNLVIVIVVAPFLSRLPAEFHVSDREWTPICQRKYYVPVMRCNLNWIFFSSAPLFDLYFLTIMCTMRTHTLRHRRAHHPWTFMVNANNNDRNEQQQKTSQFNFYCYDWLRKWKPNDCRSLSYAVIFNSLLLLLCMRVSVCVWLNWFV